MANSICFAVAGKPGSFRRSFSWHRALGMWAWPAIFVLALTGATLAWPDDSRSAVALVITGWMLWLRRRRQHRSAAVTRMAG